ncbi:MAG: sigma-70 family RNA polymerase sigma factor [Planctomycetes bacterium]|nr:sigma-70 family RNA polymerase sigma factor [Planctomycetota bacterium]
MQTRRKYEMIAAKHEICLKLIRNQMQPEQTIITDKELVKACRKGDKNAYAQLVDLYARRVFGVCLGVLGNVHDAEDAAQDALIAGFTRIGGLKKRDQFAAWITSIARNQCLDLIRRKKLTRKKLADKKEQMPSDTRDSEYRQLEKAISLLPEKYRTPLVLYYFQDQSAEKVANVLNITPAGVLTRLSRSRKKLRKLLSKEGA